MLDAMMVGGTKRVTRKNECYLNMDNAGEEGRDADSGGDRGGD